MLELVTTRDNPMIDPAMHVWGWEVPVYLFLGGWVAGSMVLAGWFMRRGREPGARCVCDVLPWIGLVLLSLGMGALFLDLEHRLYVWRMYLTLQPTSPMSWGGWILILVYPVLALGALRSLPGDWLARWPALARLAATPARARSHPDAQQRQHRHRNRARHLHRHPAVEPRGAAIVGERGARSAVPRFGTFDRRRIRARDRARPGRAGCLAARRQRFPGRRAGADRPVPDRID